SAVYCLRKTGGKITFWSAILIILAAAGLAVRELNLVSDLWSYGFSIAILAATAVSMTQLIRQYNLLSTRPLPLLFRNGKAPDSSAGTGAGILLALMISASLLVQFLHPYTVQAGQQEPQYNIYIEDYEDLLTEEEETNLYYKMAEVTPYGNAVFVSCNQTDTSALDYAKNLYYSNFGNDSGTILLIDMGTREIALYSAGWNNTVIGAEEGYIITDNIYQYASAGDYYQCAASAFEQAATLLKGGNIARPMKYINNALLALILAVLLNYLALCLQSMKRSSGRESMVAGSINEPRVSGVRWNTLQSVSAFSFVALCTVLARLIIEAMLEGGFGGGGDGGGGSSSGGSSGGASGSGGSHRF
ncbi:MAG: TPM domain-containing protein, partial [Lachnospiraceae bacterium]|nr:TPM domain-containing protein [Lachnospiraceae bacterium]